MHLHLASLTLVLALHLQLASATSSASRLPSQTSTITTLPPAQPSSGNSDPCNFEDRTELLDRVVSDWQGYNVSLLVEKCPRVCILIYGDGNPDVSGVGAMASYYIQFISTILIGPLVHLLTIFNRGFGKPGSCLSQFLNMMTTKIAWEVNLGNSYIMFALMIAAVVRINQSPPVFELDFIADLAIFQLFMAVGRSAMMSIFTQNDEDMRFKTGMMHIATVIGAIFTFFLNVGGYPNGTQSQALVAISHFCTYEDDLRIPIYEPAQPEEKYSSPWWETLLIVFSAPIGMILLWFLFLVLLCIIIMVTSAWIFLLKFLPEALRNKSRDLFTCYIRPTIQWSVWMISSFFRLVMNVVSLIRALLPIIFLIAWIASCITSLVYMQKSRRSLEKALGEQYLDTQWGFGQITAILMWAPTLLQVLGKIISFRPTTVVHDGQAQPLLGSSQDNLEIEASRIPMLNSMEEQLAAQTGEQVIAECSTNSSAEPRNSISLPYQIGGTADISRSSTPASNGEEEVFELRQRETWPRCGDGNYLPL